MKVWQAGKNPWEVENEIRAQNPLETAWYQILTKVPILFVKKSMTTKLIPDSMKKPKTSNGSLASAYQTYQQNPVAFLRFENYYHT